MKVRFRNSLSEEWEELDWKDVKKRIAYPTETYEIRLLCDHKDTWVESGIKTCKRCGEQLEVTSWRD